MLKTVGVVREREREREGELKTDVFSLIVKELKNTSKIDNTNYKNIFNKNKRIDCLAKVASRVLKKMHIMYNNMHSNNICIQLLQNSLSFLRTKNNEYRQENINDIKDKYAWK